jgi:hypothetical protein
MAIKGRKRQFKGTLLGTFNLGGRRLALFSVPKRFWLLAAPSDPAELLLEILMHDLGLKPGDEIPDQRLKARYQARGHRADEIKTALKQAHDREWVRWEEVSDRFFVTQAGYEIGDTWTPSAQHGLRVFERDTNGERDVTGRSREMLQNAVEECRRCLRDDWASKAAAEIELGAHHEKAGQIQRSDSPTARRYTSVRHTRQSKIVRQHRRS